MASIKGRLAAVMGPVAANIEEAPTEEADKIDRLLRMYDACQAGQVRLRDILPHAKGDERNLVLICRWNLLDLAAASTTRAATEETIRKIAGEILAAVQAIRELPDVVP